VVQLALVVLLVLACACNRSGSTTLADAASAATPAVAEPPKPVPAVLPDVLARVNGENITKAEFEEAIGALEQRNQAPVPPDQRDAVYRGVLDQLVGLKLLSQEVAAKKVVVPDADVDAQMAQIRQQFPSEDVFNQALKAQNKTLEIVKADARRSIAITKMLEAAIEAKVAVSPEQAKKFYDENPDQFKRPEQVRASHILIGTQENADVATKAAAKRKAEGLLKQLKAGGDFAALAKENSQDPGSAVNGGDLGLFSRGQMVGPFDQVAFTLAPGATSDLVETQFGYHIIRVMEKKEAGAVALDEVRPQLEQFLQNQNRQREMTSYIAALKAKGKVEVLI